MAWVKLGDGTLNKSKKDTGAPYFGKCNLTIDGKEHEISIGGWVKDGKEGSKFFSLAFSVPEDAAPKPAPKKQAAAEDNSVPF